MVRFAPLATALLSTAAFTDAWWKPAKGATWNIQLNNPPTPSQADDAAYQIWDMDALDTPKSTIQAFKKKGKKVICYFSAGTWEEWRTDTAGVNPKAIGKSMDPPWEDEKWFDTRDDSVRALMKRRIDVAKAKGCDGIDPDNLDPYNNDPGFPLTRNDAVDYINFLANYTHSKDIDMAFGLKNCGDIASRVVNVCDYQVNEECVVYDECQDLQVFIKAKPNPKPVFHIEYPYDVDGETPAEHEKKSCGYPGTNGFSTLFKRMLLTSWTKTCDKPQTNGAKKRGCPY